MTWCHILTLLANKENTICADFVFIFFATGSTSDLLVDYRWFASVLKASDWVL